jgi:hypothetical protein
MDQHVGVNKQVLSDHRARSSDTPSCAQRYQEAFPLIAWHHSLSDRPVSVCSVG